MPLTGSLSGRSSRTILNTQIRFVWPCSREAKPAAPSLQTQMPGLVAGNRTAAMAWIRGVRRRPDASPTRSAQSTDPEDPGWTKRLRLGSAPPDQTPCPSRVSALEHDSQLHRGTDKEYSTMCTCSGKAYHFYNLYTWEIGFEIRCDKSRLNAERTKYMQEIFCGCSAFAESLGMNFLESYAKESINVERTFLNMSSEIKKRMTANLPRRGNLLSMFT